MFVPLTSVLTSFIASRPIIRADQFSCITARSGVRHAWYTRHKIIVLDTGRIWWMYAVPCNWNNRNRRSVCIWRGIWCGSRVVAGVGIAGRDGCHGAGVVVIKIFVCVFGCFQGEQTCKNWPQNEKISTPLFFNF